LDITIDAKVNFKSVKYNFKGIPIVMLNITFLPDLPRFQMTNFDKNTVSLLSKGAYDMADSTANKYGKKLAFS
jgi:hypothetical protein